MFLENLKVLKGSLKGVLKEFMVVSRKIKECFKGCFKVLQGRFKGISEIQSIF